MNWMNLEPIIQSEASQKEEDNYCIQTHIYGIQTDGADEFICRAAMEGILILKKNFYLNTCGRILN